MRHLYLIVFIVLSLAFISCKSDSEIQNEKSRKLLTAYKNERLASYEDLYKKVTLQGTNYPELVLAADSLFNSLEKIDHLLDSLSFVLEKTDSTGERIDIGLNLLVKTPVGIRISQESFEVFQYSMKGVSDIEKQQNIIQRLSSFKYLGTSEFNEVYFSKSSSIFILMILRSLQNNLKKSALISFNDMLLKMT